MEQGALAGLARRLVEQLGDGAVASPDPGWNTHYGLPLVDCWGGQQNGQTTGAGPKQHVAVRGILPGQGRIADEAESTTTERCARTRDVLLPGHRCQARTRPRARSCSYQDKGLPTGA